MKTLRASGTRVQAEVVVGANKWGSDVSVSVTLDRKDPEVEQALEPLARVLRQRAFAYLNEAVEEAVVQRRVTEKVNSSRAQIALTAKANAEASMNGRIRDLERQLTASQRANDRLQQQLQASTEKEG